MAEKINQAEEPDPEAAFSKLFWAARKEHSTRRKAALATDPAHIAAIAFAEAQGWLWATALLEASRLNFAESPEKTLSVLAELSPSTPERWQGLFYFVKGSALNEKGEYDESIKAYRKTLADPKFDMTGTAYANLGNALVNKGNNDEAIKAYRNALADPRLDPPGRVWNNLGVALLAKGEHDEAIKAQRNALADPKFDTPGIAWNNLGNVLHDIGKHDEAIKAYRNALADPKFHTPAKAWTNLGQTYVVIGKYKEAEEAFNKALACADPTGSDHARARLQLKVHKSKIEAKALSPDDRALIARPAPGTPREEIEEDIVSAIREAGDTQYDKYLKRGEAVDPVLRHDNTLSILRGWSSAVTLLEGSARQWRGGGYFLKWRGCGVVIDPGFDFLRNFHDAEYHGREIDAVIVSHNHPDHNSDLKDIDDLRYEMWKRLKEKGGAGSQPYVLIWDQDTEKATKFGFDEPEHQHEPVVMASGFPQPLDLSKHKSKLPFRVIPFKVNHGSDVPHAMGVLIELLDEKGAKALKIGYTGDTGYFPDLHKHLMSCDVLIAHISQPTIDELQDATKLKEIHLGYRGTAKLLSECKPKLALIGEFWAGLADLRIKLVKGIQQRSGLKHVLPAGLSMHIRLPSLEIECTQCHKLMPFAEVKIAPPADQFGSLAYLCEKCILG